MCGIVGFNWENKNEIIELTSLLTHRGPEQEGYYVGGGVSIGHRRLCILDLSEKGRQPIYNEDKSICISFNGEVFNFKKIKQMLEEKGHVFKSNTDTEVIVHGYEEWGMHILNKLNGQFAFCIFDKKKEKFFMARDRLGIKPFYYYSKNEKFIFGSELKIMLKSDIPKEIDKTALNHYLFFGYTPGKQSILKNVKKLLPGHYMIYDLSRKKITKCKAYWKISFSDKLMITEDNIKQKLLANLNHCIQMELISDVPVGAFLSGGVDSSILVSVMSKYLHNLKTFSIRFDYAEFNESEYAKIISNKFGTDHHEIEFDATSIDKLIPKLVYYYDEPFGDPSMIPTYLVSSVASKHVKVCLSGTGGDELFGGYSRYNEFVLLKSVNHLPQILKNCLNSSITALNFFLKNDKLNKLKSFLSEEEPDFSLYLKLFSYLFRGEEEQIGDLNQLQYFKKYFKYENVVTNMQNFDINEYLPNCLLIKEDRAAMGVSLEVRVPFINYKLVEFVAKISPDMKIKFFEKKYILKKAFEGILPNKILYRKKKGFGVPLVHYFRKELKEFAYTEMFSFVDFQYYNKEVLQKLWDKHQKKEADYSALFWSIIMFNLWYKKWVRS